MEFALVLPVLLLVVFAILVFGVVFAQQVSVNNAARQMARAAAVPGAVCGSTGAAGSGLLRQAQLDSTTLYLDPNAATVTVKRATGRPGTDAEWSSGPGCSGPTVAPCAGSAPGENVYVRVRYVTTLNLPYFPPTWTVTGVGAFRCEYTS